MKMYLAFSTGAMMASILKRLTKRKTDINPSDFQEVQKSHPEAMDKAVDLVKRGGVFDKFISDALLRGIDPSYKNQFTNWAWVAFADKEAFDKYFENFDENRIDEDTHLTTDFQDRISDFCLHSKKHAIYKQKCRDILNLVSAKPNHITVKDFCAQMIAMNKDWDAKKKYIINEETIGESWRNIEKNEIHIDGDWGDFRAYKIPRWIDLMQTCNQTEWCVAQTGDSGQNYYKKYGEPYYLICDRKREPFALLNPSSQQFKDIKDQSIRLRKDGNALPSHRRAIYFGKEVYDKVEGGNYRGDLDVFAEVEKLKRIDEEERNDKIDYQAVVDSLGDDEIKKNSNNAFVKMMNADSSYHNSDVYDELFEKYQNLSPEEKKLMVEAIVNGSRTDGAMSFVIDDMIANDGESLLKLVEKNKKVIKRWEDTTTINYLVWLMQEYTDFSPQKNIIDRCNYNLDDVAYHIYETADYKDTVINFILYNKNCTKSVVDKIYDKIDFNNTHIYKYLFVAFEQGKIDKSAFDGIESKLKQYNTSQNYFDNQTLKKYVVIPYLKNKELCPDSVREELCTKANDKDYHRVRFEGDESPLKIALESGTGEWVDEILQSVLVQDKSTLENTNATKYATVLKNKRCTKEIIDRVLEILEYGKGYSLDTHDTYNNSIYASILNSSFVDNERFMKILKTNPRIIVRYGWNNEHCTDAVKLVLVKKIGKVNGQIFRFGKDENQLVLNEFFRSRISAGRYAEFYNTLSKNVIPDDLLVFALMKISPRVKDCYGIVQSICRNENLSDESKLYVYEHKSESNFGENFGRQITQHFFHDQIVPNELIFKAMDENDMYAIMTYLQNDNSRKEVVEKIAEKYADHSGKNDEWFLSALASNKYCPDKLIIRTYEQYKDSGDAQEIFSNIIHHNLMPAEQIAKELAEKNHTNDKNLNAILDSEKFSSEEKTSMILEMDFKKLSEKATIRAVKTIMGMKIFKKISANLNHKNNKVGYALAENEAYSREQLQPILNKNYGVTEGYYNRFGVDEAVLRSKHLHNLIDNHYCDFTKSDKKAVLNSGNEDAVWLIKKNIKRDMNIHSNIKNASRFGSIALRVALNERMDMIAKELI